MQKLHMHKGARSTGQITVNVRERARECLTLAVVENTLRAGATV
jgi:hypothetical protein